MNGQRGRQAIDAISLRDLELADLPALYTQQSDVESCRMAGVHPRSHEAFEVHWQNALRNPAIVTKAILDRGTLVGQISCYNLGGEDCVGYWVAREHWGRGIASRALELLLEQVTKRPLQARVARHNGASIRVLERNGFTVTSYEHSAGDDRYLECDEAVLVLR